ncbi:gamma-aminobutyric acid type B receptor subunit 2-like [Glandiceps talaboti]
MKNVTRRRILSPQVLLPLILLSGVLMVIVTVFEYDTTQTRLLLRYRSYRHKQNTDHIEVKKYTQGSNNVNKNNTNNKNGVKDKEENVTANEVKNGTKNASPIIQSDKIEESKNSSKEDTNSPFKNIEQFDRKSTNSTVKDFRRLPKISDPKVKAFLEEYQAQFNDSLITIATNTFGVPPLNFPDNFTDDGKRGKQLLCRMKSEAPLEILTQDTTPFKEIGYGKYFQKSQLLNIYHTPYERCAVVGTAEFLGKFKLGTDIDGHDAVMRMNIAPINTYEEIVGGKTTFHLANNLLLERGAFQSLKETYEGNVTHFAWKGGPYNGNLLRWYQKFSSAPNFFASFMLWKEYHPTNPMYIINPNSNWKTWHIMQEYCHKTKNLHHPLSSGFTVMRKSNSSFSFSRVLCYVYAIFTHVSAQGTVDIYISGMMALKGLPWGWGIRPAIELALEHVNQRPDIIPGYTLNWIVNDTWGNPGVGSMIFVEHISQPPTKLMILGPTYSSATKPVAEVAHHYNLVQVSPSATSPEFSDRANFPMFFRTIQSDLSHNPPRVALLKYFGWRKVATIHQNQPLWSTTTGKLHEGLQKANIMTLTFDAFDRDPAAQIQHLKEKDARIIVGLFWSPPARQIFCEAYKLGLYGKNYVWIINGGRPDYWWHPSANDEEDLLQRGCTKENIAEAVEGVLFTDYAYNGEDVDGVSGFTPTEIWDLYMNKLLTEYTDDESEKSPFAYFAYDSLWAIAIALNNSMEMLPGGKKLEHFTYADTEMATVFKTAMQNTNFIGASGSITFADDGDRLGRVTIHQIQDGEEVLIGYYYEYEDRFMWSTDKQFRWKGGHPPPDSQTRIKVRLRVDFRLFVAMSVLASLGIIQSVAFLIFNVKNSNLRYIKMSSPRLNNMICLGSILMYTSVYLFAMDGMIESPTTSSIICNVRIWIISVGFTLAFGALFSKTWRVHHVYFNKKLQKRVVKDRHLFGVLAVLFLIDIIMLTLWNSLDPMYQTIINLSPYVVLDEDNDEILYIPEKSSCVSNNMTKWIVVLYSYKGIITLFGLFLAWETRNVKIEALNDSKQIGLCVYNVMVLSVIGASVVNILTEDQFDVAFAVTSICVISCTASVLCIVFGPKIIKLRNNSVNMLEAATRMNVGDDRLDTKQQESKMEQQCPACSCPCHVKPDTLMSTVASVSGIQQFKKQGDDEASF